jgi:hypothetical protein
MKKIISFSLYGDLDCYFTGAIENLKMRDSYYKDWIYRFYVEDTIDDSYLKLLFEHPNVEIKKMGKSDGHSGMFWRFIPLDELDVDVFLVRDLDSRPSTRETNAVNEWINSEYSFHIIRDNKSHGVPILGGTWGAKSKFKPNFSNLLEDWSIKNQTIINNSDTHKRGKFFGLDQKFLRDCIWDIVKDDHMAHISNFENLKITGREIIMPESDGSFVGQSFLKNLNKKYG